MMQGSMPWLFAAGLTLGIGAILSINVVTAPVVQVNLGEPAEQDIVAPHSSRLASEVLTQEQRQAAAAAVPDVYTVPDLSIGRAQSNRARAVFNFMDVVRADNLTDTDTKLDYLRSLQGLVLDAQIAQDILSLSQTDYTTAKSDVLRIIEEVMRDEIREDRLSDERRLARRRVSFDLSTLQERIVTNLAPQFIVPNTFFDDEATRSQRAEAMAAVEPVLRIVTRDERIVRVGEVVDAADLELLEHLGLLQRKADWRRLSSAFIASLVSVTLLSLFWQQFFSQLHDAGRFLLILTILVLVFALLARFMVAFTFLAYLFPMAALSITLAVILDVRLSILTTVVMAALLGYSSQNSLELAVYSAVGGVMAILTLHDSQRISALFRAGLMAALGHLAVVLIFHLPQQPSAAALVELFLYGLANGLISASLALAGFYIFGGIFGVMTTVQLQDLSRLDHPLLRELLRRAPGTYHHSIMVANLAEQAAERIRANSTLVRVGAFYHDIGKMNRPPFFTENQEGTNPHDSLDPHSSARIILSHVSDGLELARRFRLPNRIRDFIAEHHGTRAVKAFYGKALEMAGGEPSQVDMSRFTYKGPRPRSRETAIVQLADAIEATSSALRPNTEAEIEKLVASIIEDHLKEDQLENSGLTLGDIARARDSFIETLKGRFHVRVRYPGNESLEIPERQEVADRPDTAAPALTPPAVTAPQNALAARLHEPVRS